eukprot:TRINITY_DN18509_c0_g2_i1.p1 TRINITY_DN18509_c0_g2~~TRINITY_DN18509_c0_g2_i1.p1  ORF type:complete len:121 (-),score=22.84 TRINITY_DN18509_c0_g2_i1:56-418(-)
MGSCISNTTWNDDFNADLGFRIQLTKMDTIGYYTDTFTYTWYQLAMNILSSIGGLYTTVLCLRIVILLLIMKIEDARLNRMARLQTSSTSSPSSSSSSSRSRRCSSCFRSRRHQSTSINR